MRRVLLFVYMGIVFSGISVADIFVQGTTANGSLQESAAQDRAGYYYHSPGLDERTTEKKLSDTASLTSGALTRDTGLHDINASFQKAFDDAFTQGGGVDKYKTATNPLLLMEYSSPALADVVKHFRMMTMERMLLEAQRLAVIEKGAEGPLDRLRMLSERDCLREKQGQGLVKAMEACQKASQPFDAITLINGQGSLSDGRRNIHVVRDALALLGLPEKTAPEKAAALSGDVVITDDDYTEILPKESFESRMETYRQKYIRKWQDALAQPDSSAAVLTELSLPGVPVTVHLLKNIGVLEQGARDMALAKLSSLLAKARARRDLDEVRVLLDMAARLPQLEQEFRVILLSHSDQMARVIARCPDEASDAEQYRVMITGLFSDADTTRQGLLSGSAQVPVADMSSKLFMLPL